MKLTSFCVALAVFGSAIAWPLESGDLANSTVLAADASDVSGLPKKNVQCGGKNPRAMTFKPDDIKKAAEASLDHVINKNKAGNYPKHYGYRDPNVHFPDAACKKGDDLYEFPISRGVYKGGEVKNIADRVIIKKKKGKKGQYCGLITHLDEPNSDFKSCSG